MSKDYFSPQNEGLVPDQDYFDWLEEMYDPDVLTAEVEGGTFLP